MLRSLRIQNLAVVERADIAFQPGLTAITGESGAGKSLVIRALALALGARADRDDCGSFSTRTVIEADFALRDDIRQALETLEIDIDSSDTTLTLRRELNSAGRSRCFVNDQLLRLGDLSELASALCEISGQSSSVTLRDSVRQLALLDEYAGLSGRVLELGRLFDDWMELSAKLRRLENSRDAINRERALLKFQLAELEDARLSLTEENELQAEKKRLDDFERLNQTCNLILATLENDESPLEALQALRSSFAEVNAIDERFSGSTELFDSALIQLEEVRRSVATFCSALLFDPERLEEINQRLSDIYQLRNKYGGTVVNALEELERIRQRLETLPDPEQGIARLQALAQRARECYTDLGLQVREQRHKAARALTGDTLTELLTLALDKARFEFVFEDESGGAEMAVTIDGSTRQLKAQRHGFESGAFFFSANPGEAPRPLARVASGGELSRVLLALKIATRKSAAGERFSPAVVFDEIDTGVSGVTATAMGRKLKELAGDEQTIVVTHLRQVVEQADNHLLVEKAPTDGRNRVTIRALNKKESAHEQLRMVDLEPVSLES